jgi:hypothetical protein
MTVIDRLSKKEGGASAEELSRRATSRVQAGKNGNGQSRRATTTRRSKGGNRYGGAGGMPGAAN